MNHKEEIKNGIIYIVSDDINYINCIYIGGGVHRRGIIHRYIWRRNCMHCNYYVDD